MSLVDEAGVQLFRTMAEMLVRDDLAGINDIMANVDPDTTDITLLVAMLAGTAKMPRDRLPARGDLYARVLEMYSRQHGLQEAVRMLGFMSTIK